MKKVLLLTLLIGGLCFAGYDLGTLVTPSIGEAITVKGINNHNIYYTTTGVSTNVVFQIEGSIDGTNYFNIFSTVTTVDSNTSGHLNKVDFPLEKIRANWTAKNGIGTIPNISFIWIGFPDF